MSGTVVNERYRLDSELGKGGMGIVYQTFDTSLERDVAIKVLNKTALSADGGSRLMREAKIVSHPNLPQIVTIHDSGELGGSPFIVMEMVSDPSIRKLSTKHLDSSITLIAQIFAAL